MYPEKCCPLTSISSVLTSISYVGHTLVDSIWSWSIACFIFSLWRESFLISWIILKLPGEIPFYYFVGNDNVLSARLAAANGFVRCNINEVT
jgi:hypothetical protein